MSEYFQKSKFLWANVKLEFDLSKLSNVVKNDVIKKTEYDELGKKLNNIRTTDTSDLIEKTDYNAKVNEVEKKLMILIILNTLLLKNMIS